MGHPSLLMCRALVQMGLSPYGSYALRGPMNSDVVLHKLCLISKPPGVKMHCPVVSRSHVLSSDLQSTHHQRPGSFWVLLLALIVPPAFGEIRKIEIPFREASRE